MNKYLDAEKLKTEITRLKGQLIRGACASQTEMETNCKDEAYNEVLAFITSLQQEQPDFDDVDPKHLVHSHYTKVREIETGRVFWAEYSSEAAEWYEAVTGRAYSSSDVEIVKEQPEVELDNLTIMEEIRKCGCNPNEFDVARHFYELGQQNRPTGSDASLEEEIEHIVECEKKFMNFQCKHQLIQYIARHFAEWGAEHLKK